MKIFVRWLRGTEEYPEKVKWIKSRMKNGHMLPEELLDEINIKELWVTNIFPFIEPAIEVKSLYKQKRTATLIPHYFFDN